MKTNVIVIKYLRRRIDISLTFSYNISIVVQIDGRLTQR